MFVSAMVFASGNETDIQLFNELFSSYNSGFYPGAVEYSNRLINEYPESAYAGAALVIQGECLVRLNEFDEAYVALLKAEKSDLDPEIRNHSKFWLGRFFDAKKEYDVAQSYYYDYCLNAGEKGQFFAQAILKSANIYYILGEYKNAAMNFEYVVQNGGKYAKSEIYNSILRYSDSCNKSGQPDKAIALYNKIAKDSVDSVVYWGLTEFTGDSYAAKKDYKKAYELYCLVLSSGEKSLAANALKKAYNISSEHRKEVGAEPGAVLQNAQTALNDSPELLGEFWTRLGIDAFNVGDFSKAVSYFNEAEKYQSSELMELIGLYRAEITAGKIIDSKSAEKAEAQLKEAEKLQQQMENPKYVQDYYRLFVKYAAYQNHWEDVKKYAEKAGSNDDSTNYYVALAQFETGDYSESAKILSGKNNELFALTLANQQKLKESALVYGKSDGKDGLTPQERLNYSKVLLLSGRYREAQIEANKSGLNEGKYILGLAQFNTWSWPYAEESFSQYLKNADKKNPDQVKPVSYAIFYQGYAQYRQGKAKEAFENLSSFISKYPDHELLWNAQMTAANAAVQMGKFDDAIRSAEAAVKSSRNNDDREESVLLCAEIYSDAGYFDNAIKLLSPYSKLKNPFGLKALYKIAQIYEKMQRPEQADEKYKEAADRFASEKLAEEAMYRRGELYYSLKDYGKALQRFNEYSSKYPNGSFAAASWYFAADCMSKTDNSNRAILQYQALIKRFSETSYVYGSYKKLIELYRADGKYSNALENARMLLQRYGDQARNDGIAEVAADLEKLASGKNEAMVAQESEYRKAGGTNTPEGRRAGTELVILYAKSSVTSNDAIKLARQLLPLQKKYISSESFWAAQNSEILAQANRAQNKNKTAAEYFLSAAEYYRMSSKGNEAAAALYGAYDAFIAADMAGDANETAKAIKNLYPQSRQAGAVKTDN